MGVSRKIIGQIINNSRRISVAEASQLAVLFQTDEDFWIATCRPLMTVGRAEIL